MMNKQHVTTENQGHVPQKGIRLMFVLAGCYTVVAGLGSYFLLGLPSVFSTVSCAVFSMFILFLTQRTIKHLLFEKSRIFYIILFFFKLIMTVFVVWLAVFKLHFDLTGMLIGFSVIPFTVITLALFPNTINS